MRTLLRFSASGLLCVLTLLTGHAHAADARLLLTLRFRRTLGEGPGQERNPGREDGPSARNQFGHHVLHPRRRPR